MFQAMLVILLKWLMRHIKPVRLVEFLKEVLLERYPQDGYCISTAGMDVDLSEDLDVDVRTVFAALQRIQRFFVNGLEESDLDRFDEHFPTHLLLELPTRRTIPIAQVTVALLSPLLQKPGNSVTFRYLSEIDRLTWVGGEACDLNPVAIVIERVTAETILDGPIEKLEDFVSKDQDPVLGKVLVRFQADSLDEALEEARVLPGFTVAEATEPVSEMWDPVDGVVANYAVVDEDPALPLPECPPSVNTYVIAGIAIEPIIIQNSVLEVRRQKRTWMPISQPVETD